MGSGLFVGRRFCTCIWHSGRKFWNKILNILNFKLQKSGLAKLFAELLAKITLQPNLTMVTLVVISAIVTQMTSNVASANVILPVISEMVCFWNLNFR